MSAPQKFKDNYDRITATIALANDSLGRGDYEQLLETLRDDIDARLGALKTDKPDHRATED